MTESLLVDGDRVFCTPGGPDSMLVAFNRHNGQVIWEIKGNGEKSAYCSPVIVKHNQKSLILTMTGKSVVGLDASNGKFLWQMSHQTRHDINPNTPLYHQGNIYTVSGYGTTGSQMFKISPDGSKITHVWSEKILDSQMGAAVLVDGYIYGSGHRNRGWHCLDWKTGKVQYTAKELGNKGNIIFSDGLLYCYAENGVLGLVKPNPRKFEVISSFNIDKGSGPHWSHPVIKKGHIYVRHGEVLMVFDINR
jgi:outer membrane protein assembly factor BamB